MRMSADHNLNFHHGGGFPQSFCNQRVVSFQPEAVNNGTGLMSGVVNSSGGIGNMAGMIVGGNTGMMSNASAIMHSVNSSGNVLIDPLQSVKHATPLAVDWSDEELAMLKRGLVTYANEHSIMKYIKIAALLPDKTVRDVAMRCRWMTKKENGKRRKPEDYSAGKKIKDRKDKMVDSSPTSAMHSIQPDIATAYSFMMNNIHLNNPLPFEGPAVDVETQLRIEENICLLNQIERNLVNNEVQDNVELFYRTRENIAAILNSMSGMPGIMSRMPSLPISVNENLVHSMYAGSLQAHSSGSHQMKEEPRCW